MKHFYLKICIIVLACLSYLPVSAYDFEADGFYFTITSVKDLTVSVDGAVNSDTDKIVLPQTVVYKNKTLTITSVGNKAFTGYKNLRSVSFPKTMLSIGYSAFAGDSLLTDIVLPDNLSTIADYAFSGTSIKEMKLPLSLTFIGEGAFRKTRIRSIALPDNIEEIPTSCFADCDSLIFIQWPKKLRSIGDHAFDGCEALKNFTIPSSVVEISPSIIWNCSNISRLTIGKGLKGLPFTYAYNRDRDISEQSSLRTYCNNDHDYHLKFLDRLDTVIIEDSYDEFSIKGSVGWYIPTGGVYWYYNCPAFLDLDYFYVGRPLTDITSWRVKDKNFGIYYKYYAYYGHIKKLEIAGTCTENPRFLQKVDTLILGENIKSFYVDNLDNEDKLKMIICKSTNPPIVNEPFLNKVYTDVTLYVPKGYKDIYSNAPEWGLFWDIKEYKDVTDITSVIDSPKDISITTNNGSIIINNSPHNTYIQVYNLQGALVAKSQGCVISGLSKGAFIVTVGGKTFKVVL